MSFLERKKTNYPRSSFLTDFDIIILQILKMEGLFDFERSKERSICVQMLLHWKTKRNKKRVFKVRAAKAFVFNFQHEEKHFKYWITPIQIYCYLK